MRDGVKDSEMISSILKTVIAILSHVPIAINIGSAGGWPHQQSLIEKGEANRVSLLTVKLLDAARIW